MFRKSFRALFLSSARYGGQLPLSYQKRPSPTNPARFLPSQEGRAYAFQAGGLTLHRSLAVLTVAGPLWSCTRFPGAELFHDLIPYIVLQNGLLENRKNEKTSDLRNVRNFKDNSGRLGDEVRTARRDSPGKSSVPAAQCFLLMGKKPPAERRAVALKAAGRARDSSPTNALPRRELRAGESSMSCGASCGRCASSGDRGENGPATEGDSEPCIALRPRHEGEASAPHQEPGCLAHATTGWSRRPENCCFLSCA